VTSKAGQRRASGQTAAVEEAREAGDKLDDDIAVDLEEESTDDPRARFRTPGFSRVKIAWTGDEMDVVRSVTGTVDDLIRRAFWDVHALLNDLYIIVRDPEVDETSGEIRTTAEGDVIWRRTPNGTYFEDYTKLTRAQRDDFLFRIITHVWDWEQRAANMWGEAMLSKAIWEEQFAIGFDAPVKGTVDDRKAKGTLRAAEDRYFAIFQTLASRKADALVRSMNALQRVLGESLR
jgi:hypothetical protein